MAAIVLLSFVLSLSFIIFAKVTAIKLWKEK